MTDSGSKAPVTRGHKGRFGLTALMTALSLMLTLGLAACDDDTPEAATTSDLSNLDAATIVTA